MRLPSAPVSGEQHHNVRPWRWRILTAMCPRTTQTDYTNLLTWLDVSHWRSGEYVVMPAHSSGATAPGLSLVA